MNKLDFFKKPLELSWQGKCEKLGLRIDSQCEFTAAEVSDRLRYQGSDQSVRKIQQFICFRAETGILSRSSFHKTVPPPSPDAHRS